VDDENTEPSSNESLEPPSWRERYRWLGVLIVAAFAGFAPAPPPPKPPKEISEYMRPAEDLNGPELDPDFYFVQQES
jgi:hypothetical protein